MSALELFLAYLSDKKLLTTLLVIASVLLVRKLLLNYIRGDVAFISEKQRKWMSRTKNSTFLLVLVAMFMLWRAEINEFALSLTAIAFALVVASKEIILCFTGSIQRASSRSFRIGDWIEVGAICGEVIEHNLMATVIQEVDLKRGYYHFTGKTVTLPNSMFFTYPVKNLNFMKRYVYHSFDIIIPKFINIYPLVPQLKSKVEKHCEEFIEVAKRYNNIIEKHAGVDLPGPGPQVRIESGALGEIVIYFMIFCPTERAGVLEQKIRADVMQELESAKLIGHEVTG